MSGTQLRKVVISRKRTTKHTISGCACQFSIPTTLESVLSCPLQHSFGQKLVANASHLIVRMPILSRSLPFPETMKAKEITVSPKLLKGKCLKKAMFPNLSVIHLMDIREPLNLKWGQTLVTDGIVHLNYFGRGSTYSGKKTQASLQLLDQSIFPNISNVILRMVKSLVGEHESGEIWSELRLMLRGVSVPSVSLDRVTVELHLRRQPWCVSMWGEKERKELEDFVSKKLRIEFPSINGVRVVYTSESAGPFVF